MMFDMAHETQLNTANVFFSIMQGAGNFLGYYVGSIHLGWFRSDIQSVFAVAIFVVISTTIVTLLSAKEIPFRSTSRSTRTRQTSVSRDQMDRLSGPQTSMDPNSSPSAQPLSARLDSAPPATTPSLNPKKVGPIPALVAFFADLYSGVLRMPNAMRRVVVVTFFSWIGWFVMFVYASVWMGVDINKGNGDARPGSEPYRRFIEGVQASNAGLSYQALVALTYSFLIPPISKRFGSLAAYFGGNLTFSMAMLTSVFVDTLTGKLSPISPGFIHLSPSSISVAGGKILIAFCGIGWATTLSIPFELVAEFSEPGTSGRSVGVFNIFIVLPQLVVAFISPVLISQVFSNDITPLLFIGGLSVMLGTILIVRIPQKPPKSIDTPSQEQPKI